MPYSYSANGLALTEAYEGCVLTTYDDVVGVPTIGYGHTGPDVTPGLTITQQQASDLLMQDVGWAVDCVNESVTVTINQNQFDAMVDFTFNVGKNAFENSTLLSLLNAENYAGAAGQFNRWVYAKGQVIPGLVRRRAGETALFNS